MKSWRRKVTLFHKHNLREEKGLASVWQLSLNRFFFYSVSCHLGKTAVLQNLAPLARTPQYGAVALIWHQHGPAIFLQHCPPWASKPTSFQLWHSTAHIETLQFSNLWWWSLVGLGWGHFSIHNNSCLPLLCNLNLELPGGFHRELLSAT